MQTPKIENLLDLNTSLVKKISYFMSIRTRMKVVYQIGVEFAASTATAAWRQIQRK